MRKTKKILALILAIMMVVSMLPLAVAASETSQPSSKENNVGLTDVSVVLYEDVSVKFYASLDSATGYKVVVKYNGETTELPMGEDGVVSFEGVTPQNFNDTIEATLYDAEEKQVGGTKTVSVKSYLNGVLGLSFENSGCSSQTQYEAMRELAVDLLNYGSAAQEYISHDLDNLANKDLAPEVAALATKNITVTGTDKAAREVKLSDAFADETINGGHGGGDTGIMKVFYKLLCGDVTDNSICDIATSCANHMLSFAADESRLSGKVIDLEKFVSSLKNDDKQAIGD